MRTSFGEISHLQSTAVSEDIEELVAEAQRGSAEAFDQLVARLSGLVWSVVRSYRLPRSDAEDAAQGVWMALVQSLDQLRDADRLPGWLATTARRECLATIRRRDRAVPTEGTTLDAMVDTRVADRSSASLEAAERSRAVAEAMSSISEQCRRLLALLATDPPIPYAEIAVLTDLTIGGIGPTRRRCIEKIRRHRAIARLIGT